MKYKIENNVIIVRLYSGEDIVLSLKKAVDEKIVFPILIGKREIIKAKILDWNMMLKIGGINFT